MIEKSQKGPPHHAVDKLNVRFKFYTFIGAEMIIILAAGKERTA